MSETIDKKPRNPSNFLPTVDGVRTASLILASVPIAQALSYYSERDFSSAIRAASQGAVIAFAGFSYSREEKLEQMSEEKLEHIIFNSSTGFTLPEDEERSLED